MAKGEKEKDRAVECPFCMALEVLRSVADRNSELVKHFQQARIEILEGIKSVLERHIEDLKKGDKRSRMKKVEVTD